MLTCVYHPLDDMRVVEEHEAERLRKTGVWFDSPKDAKLYKAEVEKDIKAEKKQTKSKEKLEEQSNER